jgi:hypothetical protein
MKIHLSQHPFFLSFLQVIGRTPSLCTLEQWENLHQYLEQSSTVASSAFQLGKTFQALYFCSLEHTIESSCFEFHLEVDKSIYNTIQRCKMKLNSVVLQRQKYSSSTFGQHNHYTSVYLCWQQLLEAVSCCPELLTIYSVFTINLLSKTTPTLDWKPTDVWQLSSKWADTVYSIFTTTPITRQMVERLSEIRTIKVCRDVPHLCGKGLFYFQMPYGWGELKLIKIVSSLMGIHSTSLNRLRAEDNSKFKVPDSQSGCFIKISQGNNEATRYFHFQRKEWWGMTVKSNGWKIRRNISSKALWHVHWAMQVLDASSWHKAACHDTHAYHQHIGHCHWGQPPHYASWGQM